MKLAVLLGLPATILSAVYAATDPHEYREHLHLKPLPGGSLYAGFSFNATTSLGSYDKQHYRYFPRSLAQILHYTHTAELHLRFSLGRWDEETWGSRPRSGLREGGNGVELWAWLESDAERKAEERWSDLVNSLSGLFCASLNFIDSGKTVRPLLSFDPEGSLREYQAMQERVTGRGQGELQLLHGMLPHEVVCTENLTPFLKLLPCKGKAGISSLLDGHKVFDSEWQTMSVDVRPACHASGTSWECQLEIQQTVDMVLNTERSQRPHDDPIPRPKPIEEIKCDASKSYNGEDTCYPVAFEGEREWTLSKIFGRPLRGSCLASGSDTHDVSLAVPSERTVEVISKSTVSHEGDNSTRSYYLPDDTDFDLHLPQQVLASNQQESETASVHASRQITGYGQERGGMHTTLHNPHPWPQDVIYLESLPWFLRPYVHTLSLSAGTIKKTYYTPLLDRQRGTQLELLIELPAESTVELTYDFEKAILRYSEYPPDANRGFDIPAAVIRVLPGDSTLGAPTRENYLRTTSLLLPLPTPDFSMPYNVIILTSTVIALGFGSIFNLLIRRFVLLEEVPTSPLVAKVRQGLAGLKKLLAKSKAGVNAGDESNGKTMQESSSPVKEENGRPKEHKKSR